MTKQRANRFKRKPKLPSRSRSRLAHQRSDRRRERETERGLVGVGTHLPPRLPQDIHEFFPWIVGVLGRERLDLVFQKHKTRRILERLRAYILFQIGF